MRTVGLVYKWKEPFLGSAFWKEYRLSLDDKGWIVWSKVTGEVKAVARLHVVFPQIRCQPLDQSDPRLTNSVVRIAPYTLVIPMKLQYGSRAVEDIEFALRTLDDLQQWMSNFASNLGASKQFEDIERQQGPIHVVAADRFNSMYPRSNVFVYGNRYNYAPDWYPVWWSSFQTSGFNYHGHGGSPVANINDDSNWLYPGGDTFSYAGDEAGGAGDTFSYGGDHNTGSGDDHGSFSYGGDGDGGGGGDQSFSYGGDDHVGGNEGDNSFSYGGDTGDTGGGGGNENEGSFSYGGDTGGDAGSGGNDESFSYGGDTGGGGDAGNDSSFSYGGDTGGDSGGGGSADPPTSSE